jgi:hypothetical protein
MRFTEAVAPPALLMIYPHVVMCSWIHPISQHSGPSWHESMHIHGLATSVSAFSRGRFGCNAKLMIHRFRRTNCKAIRVLETKTYMRTKLLLPPLTSTLLSWSKKDTVNRRHMILKVHNIQKAKTASTAQICSSLNIKQMETLKVIPHGRRTRELT